eukprot:6178195-Pleurochrysis_carterae.AAC.1
METRLRHSFFAFISHFKARAPSHSCARPAHLQAVHVPSESLSRVQPPSLRAFSVEALAGASLLNIIQTCSWKLPANTPDVAYRFLRRYSAFSP